MAYILARHRPDSGCTFPFLSNRLNIKYLTASRFFSDQDSLCVNYVNSNRLGTYANLIVNEIPSQDIKLSNSETDSIANSIVAGGRKINIECTLFSKAGRDQILKKLEFLKNKRISNPQLQNGIYFIHDLSFHDYIEKYKFSMNGIGSVGSEFLKWDRLHKDVITQFIQDIRRDYLVDNVHIMSDHGPRLPNIPSFLGEGTVPSKDYPEGRADYGSFMSKYNYGYFIGSFNITKRLQNFPFWNTQNPSIDKWDLLDGVPYQLCRYRCWED